MPIDRVAVPPNYMYTEPEIALESKKDFVSFSPISGESFGSNETCTIQINSSSALLDPSRSWLEYDVKLTMSNTSDSATFSGTGSLVSAMGAVKVNLGGVQLENIERYNNLVSIEQRRVPNSYKNTLARLEGRAQTSALSGSTNKVNNGRRCHHAIRAGLFEGSKLVPLPWIRGGLELALTVSSLETFLAANANSACTAVKISNVRFIACMITPTAEYLKSFNQRLSEGYIAKIPLTLTKSYRFVPTTLTEQTRTVNTGFLKSLNSITLSHRTSSALTDATADSFVHHSGNCKSYSFRIGSDKYPRNFDINCQPAVASGTPSHSGQMMDLCSIDNSYALMDLASENESNVDNVLKYDFRYHQGSFGSGVAVEDGSVDINLNYNSDPSSYTADLYVRYDAIVEVSATSVSLNSRSF